MSERRAEELPVVGPLFGWHRTAKGWVVVAVHVQGERVVGTEVLNPEGKPMPRGHAEGVLKRALVERLFLVRGEKP